MKSIEEVFTFENLYRAHRRARLGKRHKKEVIEFEMNLSENLWALHYELKYGKYQVGGYHKFMIYDPKEREIQAISYRDRIVQHCLCDNYLMPLLERRLIYDNCACRKGKGTDFAMRRLRGFITEHNKKHGQKGYFIKVDISKYFNSISHEVLKRKIETVVKDKEIKKLLFLIIDSYEFSPKRGIPMGNQTSQCCALLYLDTVDRYIKETLRIKNYVRYMDDMILLVDTQEEAKRILGNINRKIEEQSLKMNKKSQIIPKKMGISFLGWKFFSDENGQIKQTLTQKSQKRIKKKIKIMTGLIYYKKIKQKRLEQSYISYHGHLSRGNTYLFEQTIKERLFADKSA